LEVTRQAVAYIITFGRVRITVVAVEDNKYAIFRLWICSFRYSAQKAHAPYISLSVTSPAVPYYVTLSQTGYDFGKSFGKNNLCFDFLYKFV
jgi:hypothetical protein